MPISGLRCETNPFESPVSVKVAASTSTETSRTRTQQPDVLATTDLLIEQLKELESLCSTVEERVQRKRRALKELEYLILGLNTTEESPCTSPACPANTPTGPRPRLVPPRLQGLFDLRGPGQVNLDATQSCLDYSPENQTEENLSTREDPGHSGEWVDDDGGSLCPFDDKYAIRESPGKAVKVSPAVPRKRDNEVLGSKIPRTVRRQVSVSRGATGRSSGTIMRSGSHRRYSGARNAKATNTGSDLKTKGTMRRGSWKRSILENVRTSGGTKLLSAIENESSGKDSARISRKEKRKGLWSIYSVCSELGLNGIHYAT